MFRDRNSRDWKCLNVRFDDAGTFDDDVGDDSVLDFFLSRSISECSNVLARFNSECFDVPGGVRSCFEIGTQEREREREREGVRRYYDWYCVVR